MDTLATIVSQSKLTGEIHYTKVSDLDTPGEIHLIEAEIERQGDRIIGRKRAKLQPEPQPISAGLGYPSHAGYLRS